MSDPSATLVVDKKESKAMKVQASKVQVGNAVVINGYAYKVTNVFSDNGIVTITIETGNYMSLRWNNKLEVTFPDCERCKWDNAVPHTNCLYYGTWHMGHSSSHCTANACY